MIEKAREHLNPHHPKRPTERARTGLEQLATCIFSGGFDGVFDNEEQRYILWSAAEDLLALRREVVSRKSLGLTYLGNPEDNSEQEVKSLTNFQSQLLERGTPLPPFMRA